MSNKYISNAGTVTLSAKIFNRTEIDGSLGAIIGVSGKYEELAQRTLLIARGKPYTLHREHFGEKEVVKQQRELYKPFARKISFGEFQEALSKFYESVILGTYINKKTKKRVKIPKPVNSFYSILFSPEQKIKLTSLAEEAHILRKIGFLPFVINNVPLPCRLRQSVTAEIIKALQSMEAKQKDYQVAKENYNAALKTHLIDLPKLGDYGRLLMSIRELPPYANFDAESYKKLLNRWRGKIKQNKKGNAELKYDEEKSLQKFLKDCPKDTVFEAKDKFRFGYDPCFMNLLLKHKDLFDVIGDNDYVKVVLDSFHWRREHVNHTINSKSTSIHLGNNFLNFSMGFDENNKSFFVDISSPYGKEKGKKKYTIRAILCRHKILDSSATVTEIKPKGTYSIRYSQDSKKKTWYVGNIREPKIRKDIASGTWYIEIPVSNLHDEAVEISVEGRFKDNMQSARAFLSSSPVMGRAKEKHMFGFENFRAVGVDIGLCHPFSYSVGECSAGKDGMKIEKIIAQGHSWDSKDMAEKRVKIKNIENKTKALQQSVNVARKFISGYQSLEKLDFNCRDKINWLSIIKMTEKSFKEFLSDIYDEDEQVFWNRFKSSERNPFYHRVNGLICQELGEIRGCFRHKKSEEKRKHNIELNHVDYATIRLRSLLKQEISRRRSFSNLGLSLEQRKVISKDFCKSLWEWREGLTDRMTKEISSAIVNIARLHKARFIFLEDLDTSRSVLDDISENDTKDLIGFGKLKEKLEAKALKHNIAIIYVDPEDTSQIHYDSGKLGLRFERDNLTVLYKGKIITVDADINASKNILLRGINRNTDLRTYWADQIGDNEYRVFVDKKRKPVSLANFVGNAKILKGTVEKPTAVVTFEKRNNKLVLKETEVKKETLKKPAIGKYKTKIVRDGNEWSLADDLIHSIEDKAGRKLEGSHA